MNEKQIKTVTLLGKVSGVATALSAKAALLPEKYTMIGIIIAIVASFTKDAAMYLTNLWDNKASCNKPNTPPAS